MAGRTGTASPSRLSVVFAAAELAPLAQTGGLGDAVAGLAHALARRGHRVHCLLPAYRELLHHPACPTLGPAGRQRLETPDGPLEGRWLLGRRGALQLHLLDFPSLYDRPGLYGGDDEAWRFIAFSRAAAARARDLLPDVLVAHDWHAALTLAVTRTLHDLGPGRGVGTLQVVHNGAHLGRAVPELMPWTGLPGDLFQPDGLEFHGGLCLLKGGLAWADRIVAVSPSYAEELRTTEFGEGLEGLYRYRSARLQGITNGIDTDRYDPACDPALAEPFDSGHLTGRAACRKALLEEMGLEPPAVGRLLGAVGRFAEQKGWDVIADAAPTLVEHGASLALLGDGDAAIAARLEGLARRFPGRIALARGWNETLARRVYGGVDALLVPSRFEPCGLVQLLAQRYGALPIAHAVGGLRDTLRDGETGILFDDLSAASLVEAVDRGAALAGRRAGALQRDLLELDVSWAAPAARWEAVLAEAAAEARGRI